MSYYEVITLLGLKMQLLSKKLTGKYKKNIQGDPIKTPPFKKL